MAMDFEFGPEEDVRAAIRRCAREQAILAERQLSNGTKRDPVDAVHKARKAIKKERALLRLARGAMPKRQRASENQELRDIARTLSGTRDADVMIETLDALAERFSGQLPKRTFTAVGKRLERRRDAEHADAKDSDMASDAADELRAVQQRVDEWKLKQTEWEALDEGIVHAYKRGRRALAAASADPTLENLHGLRKRVKDVWYQLRLVTPVCGPTIRGQAKEAHRLADLLGDDHDLGVLRETVVGESDEIASDVEAVLALIDLRRRELQAEAFHAADRLYTEKTKAFRRRLRRAWVAGRALSHAQHNGAAGELAKATRVTAETS